jgi:hypothetical protein
MYIESMRRCVDHRIAYELSAMMVIHHYLYPLLLFLSQESFGRIVLEHWDEIQFDQAIVAVGNIITVLNERQVVELELSSHQD